MNQGVTHIRKFGGALGCGIILSLGGCTGMELQGRPVFAPQEEVMALPAPVDPLTRYQDFPKVRVEVASLQVLADDHVSVVLRYINKTRRDFVLALPDWCSNTTGLIDEAGNQYRCRTTTGIDNFQGLSLSTGSQVTASFLFDPPHQMSSKGARFSFNSTHLLLVPVAKGQPVLEARYGVTFPEVDPVAFADVPRVDAWEYPQIKVELANLQAAGGNQVSLAVRYINKTQRAFLLTLPDWCSNTTVLVDEAGNQYRCRTTTGIDNFRGLSLPAGGQATASFVFDPPQGLQKQGARFSFTSTHLLLVPVVRGDPLVEARYGITLLRLEPR